MPPPHRKVETLRSLLEVSSGALRLVWGPRPAEPPGTKRGRISMCLRSALRRGEPMRPNHNRAPPRLSTKRSFESLTALPTRLWCRFGAKVLPFAPTLDRTGLCSVLRVSTRREKIEWSCALSSCSLRALSSRRGRTNELAPYSTPQWQRWYQSALRLIKERAPLQPN